MTDNIKNSISSIIQQNLPEAVGVNELKTELIRLCEIEEAHKAQSLKLEKAESDLAEKISELNQLRITNSNLLGKNAALKINAESLQLAQIKINEIVLQAKLDAANTSIANLLNLAQVVFKSPIGQRTIFENQDGYTSATGQWVQPRTLTKNESFTEVPG
jgi:hypothetical protein